MYNSLIIFIILGIVIVYEYILISFHLNQKQLWGSKVPQKFKQISYVTIFLSFLCGIYLIYYFSKNEKQLFNYLFLLGLLCLLGGAIFWPFTLFFNNLIHKIFALFLTFIGVCLLLVRVVQIQEKQILPFLTLSFLLFQTGIMDLIIWPIYQ